MKKYFSICLFALGGLISNQILAQAVNPGDGVGNAKQETWSQNFLTVAGGFGNGNLLYVGLKALENAMPSSGDTQLINVGVSRSPLTFFKVEYRIKPKHSLGLNFAHSDFSIHGDVKDSFFYNDLGIPVQTNLNVHYLSTSCNLRYNYFFNPEAKVKCYIGASIGIRGNRISVSSNNPLFKKNIANVGLRLASVPSVGGDFTLGFRGNIYKSLMLFGEVGAAKALFQAGIACQF